MKDEKTILEHLLELPQAIDYRGWRFIPMVLPDESGKYPGRIGYYLSELLDRKPKYKKEAFNSKPRFWVEKKSNYWLDSHRTNFLVQEPIVWNDKYGVGIAEAIQELLTRLESYGVITRKELAESITDFEFVDDTPNSSDKNKVATFENIEADDFERFANF
jgi:hypothetical protein